MKPGKKIFFASDFHLKATGSEEDLKREKLVVRWLDEIQPDTESLYLLGDVFDFWFEYKKTVPKGFVRILGKLAGFTDSGIPVHFFTGNHDLWIFEYLPKEVGLIIHREPYKVTINGKKFYLAHGDGLGPGDRRYKLLKRVFTHPFSHWLFRRIPPRLGISFAHRWSRNSRNLHEKPDEFRGEENETLIRHSRSILGQEHFDFLIFGHRHIPIDISLSENSRYINLGDWIHHNSYGVFDGESFELKKYR